MDDLVSSLGAARLLHDSADMFTGNGDTGMPLLDTQLTEQIAARACSQRSQQ